MVAITGAKKEIEIPTAAECRNKVQNRIREMRRIRVEDNLETVAQIIYDEIEEMSGDTIYNIRVHSDNVPKLEEKGFKLELANGDDIYHISFGEE